MYCAIFMLKLIAPLMSTLSTHEHFFAVSSYPWASMYLQMIVVAGTHFTRQFYIRFMWMLEQLDNSP